MKLSNAIDNVELLNCLIVESGVHKDKKSFPQNEESL